MGESIELRSARGVRTDDVNKLIQQVWDELQESDEAADLLRGTENPFHAERREGQFDVATTIFIAVAGGLLKDAASSVWKDYVWPALKAKFGRDLEVREDAPPH